MVIGCCGAGKSTFAKALHEAAGLELIHLDQHYWKAGWIESDAGEWVKAVQALADRPSWVIDGNYGGTMDIRINRADTIIYLDCPTWKCLWRVTKRILRYWRRTRPDMPEGCAERFDLQFFHYVATFNAVRRKKLLDKISLLKGEKDVVILRNGRQVRAYLAGLQA